MVRRCLTHCQMIYEILQSAHRPSDSRWRLIFSLPISTFSALGVSHVMRSINVRYLLTYTYLLTSVCPSVAYIANNSKTRRLTFGTKVLHLWCDSHTSFKVKRLKIKVTRPINADTSCAISSERQGLRTSNLAHGWRTTTRMSHRRHDLQG